MNTTQAGRSPAQVLAAATAAVRRRRLAEVDDLVLISEWAALHSDDVPTQGRLLQVGGEGTPGVQEFCLGEIALARGTGYTATRNALADVLDLQHRLPLTWAVVCDGEAEVFIARRIARLSRHLPLDVIGLVDAAISTMIARESGGRVLDVAAAKIIEADPDLHQRRIEAEKTRRYVALTRTDEYGLRTLIARIETGDAAWIDATITRVADILTPAHLEKTADEIRAIAFGYLARPAELLQLLLEHTQPVDEAPECRALALPTDLLDALRELDLTVLRPKAVVYVHLHEAALHGHDAVARVEGLGPTTLAEVAHLLEGCDITVKPVIDLADQVRHAAYEHPESLKERVYLATGGDYFPYATSTSRHVDYDHVTPYNNTGPPGQTGTHNSGPLGRRHHRLKTHAGYRTRQLGDHHYLWLTPHGLGFLVNHQGTRPINPHHAQELINAA